MQFLMPGPFVTNAMMDPAALGFEALGKWVAPAVQSTPVVLTPARVTEGYLLLLSIPGMASTTSQVGLRFNNDSGPNYWWRNFISPNVFGLASFNNQQQPNQTEMNLYGTTGTENARVYMIFVMNRADASHLVVHQAAVVATAGAASNQVGEPNIGCAEWIGPANSQVNSFTLVPLGAGAGFGVGTSLQVYGGDL